MKIVKLRQNGVFVIALLVLQIIVFIIAALAKTEQFPLILSPMIVLFSCCIGYYLTRIIVLVYGVIKAAINGRKQIK